MGRRIQVAVRLRPGKRGQSCVSIEGEREKNVVVSDLSGRHANSIPRRFRVDEVVTEDCSNEELFRSLVMERVISSVEQPDTSCFLAYGHTSSGKTHTIAGSNQEPGLLSFSAKAVLDTYGIAEVAMLEVYGETVHDLLAQGERRLIRRRSSPDGTIIVVEDLTTCSLSSMEEWEAVSRFGMQTRRMSPTERNPRSSRSHAIFTIKSRGLRLCLVDLAGSERQTTYSPQLNRESIAINKSLSRLSTVLEALSVKRVKADGTTSYVNFRDTTLTVLLQRYLSGASMTVFLACIHPDTEYFQETMSTMRYTQRLKRIKTKAAPRNPSQDMSLFRSGESQDLLAELMLLRKIVEGQKQEQQQRQNNFNTGLGNTQREEIDHNPHLGHLISAPPSSHEDVAKTNTLTAENRKLLLRSKDTKRVAGWLLSRILGELPELSVGFDDYFDPYLPPEVQVVGYVSVMACLAPRNVNEAVDTLAFLDVGDIAMGLSMLDAGIPACVGLHRLHCGNTYSWEAHEYDDNNKVFVLAFFEITSHLVEEMDDACDAFDCCGGLLTLEPLLPVAIVLCTPFDASDELKENILRNLVTLQGEQDSVMETATLGSPMKSLSIVKGASLFHSVNELNTVALRESSYSFQGHVKNVSSENTPSSPTAPLANEIEWQARHQSQLCSPFQEPTSVNSGEEVRRDCQEGSTKYHFRALLIASSSSSSSSSSLSLSIDVKRNRSVASYDREVKIYEEKEDERKSEEKKNEEAQNEVLSTCEGHPYQNVVLYCNSSTTDSIASRHGTLDETSASLTDVCLDINGSATSVLNQELVFPDTNRVTSVQFPPLKVFEPHQNNKDNNKNNNNPDPLCGEVPRVSVEVPLGVDKSKKKKKNTHRKRAPVMQGCHSCTVL
ncbi:Kinesin motor domain [Trypanosoma melophagium]|uniref:Kinesin motor domain n=1 Tax=Trypanosoma melophagium TaxID=715481 RepID=UPI00351A2BBA|nr:Kinesin motor domain [Trypanosoma melophagium]